ncbi:hypothetical protein SESBI_02399 [Sesbania bispinosa]|nr:hypothetical protein SESBI_02399 [Sesbania bispinosa]
MNRSQSATARRRRRVTNRKKNDFHTRKGEQKRLTCELRLQGAMKLFRGGCCELQRRWLRAATARGDEAVERLWLRASEAVAASFRGGGDEAPETVAAACELQRRWR